MTQQIKVLVTRDLKQSDDFKAKLENSGYLVYEFPVIEITKTDNLADLDLAIEQIHDYDWLIFTSVNATQIFYERCLEIYRNTSKLQQIKIAVIGPKSKSYLLERNINVHFMPITYIAECFVEEFPYYPQLKGLKILFPRASHGRDYIIEKFTHAGAYVNMLKIYQSTLPKDLKQKGNELKVLLQDENIEIITLLSAQTAQNYSAIYKTAGLDIPNLVLACIGPETLKMARQNFPQTSCLMPSNYTLAGLVKAINDYVKACK